MIPVQQQRNGVTFTVTVQPKAKHERISGVMGEALKLQVTAPPIEGRANEACIRFFAILLKVPRSSITIAAGLSSRRKVIRIIGIRADVVEQAFADALRC